jgi:hypothetical protein
MRYTYPSFLLSGCPGRCPLRLLDQVDHFPGAFDVRLLSGLAAALEEQDDLATRHGEIEAIARPDVHPELAQLAAEVLEIAEQAGLNADDPRDDRVAAVLIGQSLQPLRKFDVRLTVYSTRRL